MANGAGESLEKAMQELVQQVVQQTLQSARTALPGTADSGGPGALTALNQSVNQILRPAGQTEIMQAALTGAAALAGRCAMFARRGESFVYWRSEGFLSEQAAKLKALSVATSEPGIFKDLCETLKPVRSEKSSASVPPGLGQQLSSGGGSHVCLLPVIVRGKIVAAIYSDGMTSDHSDLVSGLEILARVAGLSLETANARVSAAETAPKASASPPPPAAEPVSKMETEPAAVSEEAFSEPVPMDASSSTEAPEPPSRGSFAGGFAVASEIESPIPPPPDLESLAKEDRDKHKKAHRFARVAVQDLCSYHKDKVEQGRQNRNLYFLLKEDIEKTRENYYKKFAGTPAASFDYLHYEIVAMLAGNDLSVLGEDYPGSAESPASPAN